MTSSTTPHIRPAHGSDVDAIRRIYGAAVTGTFASFEEAVPDREELLRRVNTRPRRPWLVAGSVDPTEAGPTEADVIEGGDGVWDTRSRVGTMNERRTGGRPTAPCI